MLIAPISPYGFHKAACELLAREYSECFDLDIIVCRFFSIFGVAQRCLLIWELFEQAIGPSPIVWLEGVGTETRDYLYVDDIWPVILHFLETRVRGMQEGKPESKYLVVNIARGEEIKVIDVARQLRDFVAPDKDIRCRAQKMAGHPEHWCADISLLRSLIPDWCPKPFSLALSRCVASWQKKQSFLWK